MKYAMLCLIGLLLITGGPTVGQEATVLEQLDGTLGRLVDRADAATVKLQLQVASVWKALPDPRSGRSPGGLEFVSGMTVSYSSVTNRGSAAGVLVGKPPVLVTSADAVGSLTVVSFELADGTNGSAKLKGIDRDLGVAVFTLPAEVAAGRVGLTVKSIPRVRRGRLVLVPGPGDQDVTRPLGLAISRGHAELCGWFVVDGLTGKIMPGRPAVGMDGRLLGIAARSVGTSSGLAGTPLILSGEFDKDRRLVKVTPEPDEASRRLKAAAVLALGRLDRDSTYNYWIAEGPTGDPLPEGAFIQGSSIARVLEDLEKHGEVRHSYLGVVLGQMRGKGEDRGVEVQAVLEGSPAETAGIKAGAVIRSVAGVLVEEPALVTRALVLHRPGDSLKVQLVTVDEVLTVVLGDRNKATESLLTPEQLGLTGVDLGAELASYLQLPEGTQGVVVQAVRPQSPAARAGLARGQVIVEGGGEAIADLEELRAAVAGAKGEVGLVVLAGGVRRAVTLKIPATPYPRKAR